MSDTPAAAAPVLDALLLEILACPACDDRPSLRLDGAELVCDRCRRHYPIRDGIPEVLVESATIPEGPAPPAPGGSTE